MTAPAGTVLRERNYPWPITKGVRFDGEAVARGSTLIRYNAVLDVLHWN